MGGLKQSEVEVGQEYVGWDKTWRITRVWEAEQVAAAVNVDDETNTVRLPITQFKEWADT